MQQCYPAAARFGCGANGGLTELQRGTTLGATGWAVGTTYDFRFVFLPRMLQLFVNNALQMNTDGVFNDGSLTFYNCSPADVTYSAFTVRQLPPTTTVAPEPASVALLTTGFW